MTTHHTQSHDRILYMVLAVVLGGLFASSAIAEEFNGVTLNAPLLEGLGDHHHPITTNVPLTQWFFDQGLMLAYGFNHAEAERSFREAARLDPKCAMAWWGVALVLGPNINAPMSEDAVPKAWEALQNAKALAEHASEKERAYIEALSARYSPDPEADREALDLAYAEAMGKLAKQYPDDLDAVALYAEAMMDTMPWDYWQEDGKPKPMTEKVMAALESVLERQPNHAGANHFYIHTVEAVHPERGIAAADRLNGLIPGAGHLVHMPSHIYLRVGRYHDATAANERAVASDDAYVTQCHAQGLYPLAYVPHNHHFLLTAAAFEGRSELAIEAAQVLRDYVDQTKMREPGYEGILQHFWAMPLYMQVRFGKWDDVSAAPQPDADLNYLPGVWEYAQAMAYTRKGQFDQAQQHVDALAAIAARPELADVLIWEVNSVQDVLGIAHHVAAGELAAAQGQYDAAIDHLQQATSLEDSLTYIEPPDWHQPVRQTFGAVLLEADRPAEAERVYREDLAKYPENGWSLFGLHQALLAQDKTDAAKQVKQQFDQAWEHADVQLQSSRF